MTENNQDELLERIAQQQVELLLELKNINQRPKKDIWDRLNTLTPILSAAIIACGGAFFTISYNQQQLKVQEIQTIEKFIPHLVGDEKAKRAAILAMSSLGNAKLAARVASIFASEGTASALTSLAKSETTNADKEAVREALYRTLDTLADRYKYENKMDDAVETYKRALAVKEADGKQSPEVADALDKLARLYEQRGDNATAEDLTKRSAAVRKNVVEPTAEAAFDEPKAAAATLETTQKKSAVGEAKKVDTPTVKADPVREINSQRTETEAVHGEEHNPRSYAHTRVEQ